MSHNPNSVDPALLEIDRDADQCLWFVDMTKPICGEVPVKKVKVKTRLVEAYVDLCSVHLAEHNRRSAENRTSRRGGRR